MTKRYYVIDYIRTFVILNMILYHTVWDLIYIFKADIGFDLMTGNIWQSIICITFIFISGFCWSLSRNHLKRGIHILICGLIISFVTKLVIPDNYIVFGILTFIGSAVIIMIMLEKLLKHINEYIGLLLSFVMFVLIKNINFGTVCFGKINVSEFLYDGYFMTYLGFMKKGFNSADYFSILPWIFMFTSGYFAYKLLAKKDLLLLLKGRNIKPITFVSRNSLIIYMIHQPIVYFVLSLFYGGYNV